MKNILLIDTSSNKEIRVGLRVGKEEHIIKQKIGRSKAQVVLSLIDKLLNKQRLNITDINGIEVNVRSGSFTGIRVGISIANALSFALKIPVKKLQFD